MIRELKRYIKKTYPHFYFDLHFSMHRIGFFKGIEGFLEDTVTEQTFYITIEKGQDGIYACRYQASSDHLIPTEKDACPAKDIPDLCDKIIEEFLSTRKEEEKSREEIEKYVSSPEIKTLWCQPLPSKDGSL